MSDQLIECVPNFSEGRDLAVIRKITEAIEGAGGVRILDVDPGQSTNRTVVTFVGAPEAVVEAALAGVRTAAEVIDMRQHTGEHPRFGATDVCPLVPVAGITMEETVRWARELARRVGEELAIPVYCYERAASDERRRNLAVVRAGEYEGLAQKLADPDWQPDFGPAALNPRAGATAVGARDFLVAYNINLNTTSTRRANAIAFDVRERGRVKREGHPLTGKIVRDETGEPVMVAGSLRAVKAIGWYIDEYGIAQISMNLTDTGTTPIHVAFDEVCRCAEARGMRVTGSEIVGLVPLQALLDAGRYFLAKQQRSMGVPDRELLKIAVRSLGLDDLYPFKPAEKIIEYAIAEAEGEAGAGRLVDRSVEAFVEETASESPAPGGGSVAAVVGSLGAALATMVANLSAHKRGWDERWREFSDWAEKGQACQVELLRLVDEDTRAFNAILEAFGLPKKSAAEKAARQAAIQAATRRAMETPFRIMEQAFASMEVTRAMAEIGLPASASDAGVSALCARSAVMGAFLNVRINGTDLEDREFVDDLLARGQRLQEEAQKLEAEILEIVEGRF